MTEYFTNLMLFNVIIYFRPGGVMNMRESRSHGSMGRMPPRRKPPPSLRSAVPSALATAQTAAGSVSGGSGEHHHQQFDASGGPREFYFSFNRLTEYSTI